MGENSLIMEETTVEDTEAGEHIAWESYDRPAHDRGRTWHILMPLAAVLLLIYAVLSANFLFAFIIILFALITYLASLGEPERIRFAVTDGGIVVGTQRIPFKDIRRFWFIYEPPQVKRLYLETTSWIQPRISVELDHIDPNDVRTTLGRFVKEDLTETEEPFSDFISRKLKL